MAFDAFLKLTGVDGESKRKGFEKQIEILSFSIGASNPSTVGQGGGGGAGKVSMQDFHFTMTNNKASPKLFLACATGQHMKEAKLSAVKTGAMQQEYLSWTFADVLVTSYQTSGAGGDISMDSVSLAFSKVRVEYKAQKADGSLNAAVTAGWDLKANKKV